MWRLKRDPGAPVRVELDGVDLADEPAPAALSPEALAAATCGPMPLTDEAAFAAAGRAEPLPQRHPLAGRRFDDDDAPTPYADEIKRQLEIAERRILTLGELLNDASQKAKDAGARADALEAERTTGACADCAGLHAVIAEMKGAQRAHTRAPMPTGEA